MAAKRRRLRRGRLYAGRLFGPKQGATPAPDLQLQHPGASTAATPSSQAVHIPLHYDTRGLGRKKRNRAIVLLRP